MRVAVTGATGVLGRYFVDAFTTASQMRHVDEPAPPSLLLVGRTLQKLENTFGRRTDLQFVQTDYSVADLERNLRGVSAVVHLAARRPEAGTQSLGDFVCNILTTEALLIACRTLGITNLVFASTGSVYSSAFNQRPFTEDQAVCPHSFYAISKLACEALGPRYGVKMKSLRLAQLVAVGEREQYMLMSFISQALSGENIVVFGTGHGTREYLYAKDAAEALLAALRKPDEHGVFNVGMGRAISHIELASTIASVFEAPAPETDPTRPSDTSRALMDGGRFARRFDWRPRTTLAEALSEIRDVLMLRPRT